MGESTRVLDNAGEDGIFIIYTLVSRTQRVCAMRYAAYATIFCLCIFMYSAALGGSKSAKSPYDRETINSKSMRDFAEQNASDSIEPSSIEILSAIQSIPPATEQALQSPFHLAICGDPDNSGSIDIDDVVYLISYIFSGGPPPEPEACAGDADGSGSVDIDDVVFLIAYIFTGGPQPEAGCCGVSSSWERIGPYDSNGPSAMACNPSNGDTLLVGTSGHSGLPEALFRTTNKGKSWETPFNDMCISIAIDPADTRTIYAGIFSDLWKSTDAGVTWDSLYAPNLNPAFWYAEFISLTLDPSDTRIIYACGFDIFVGYFLFKSADAGSTWSILLDYYEDPAIIKVAVDPLSQNTIYGAAKYDGVYRSTDGGVSWEWKNNGLTNFNIFDVETGTVTDGDVETSVAYVASYGGGIFRSSDGGESWQSRNNGLLTLNTTELAINDRDGNRLYAGTNRGMCTTTDGGLFWSAAAELPIYHVENFGRPPDSSVLEIAASSTHWDLVYVSRFDVVYCSTDGGGTWDFIGLPIAQVTTIEVDPFLSSEIYCGSMFGVSEFHSSTNFGDDWLGWDEPEPDPSGITVIKADPQNAGNIYMGSYNGGSGFYRTTDGGETWVKMVDGLPNMKDRCIEDLALDPENSEIVYIGALNGVFKTENGGLLWQSTGLTMDTIHVMAVEVNPGDPNIVYAATYRHGLHRSTDAGDTWAELDPGPGDYLFFAMAVDPNHPDDVYVGTYYNGILKSTDAGQSWASASNGLGSAPIRSLLVYNPSPSATVLYAGGWGDGVFRSTDGGDNWELLSLDGLANKDVSALEYSLLPDGTFVLFAGTYGGSIFRMLIP